MENPRVVKIQDLRKSKGPKGKMNEVADGGAENPDETWEQEWWQWETDENTTETKHESAENDGSQHVTLSAVLQKVGCDDSTFDFMIDFSNEFSLLGACCVCLSVHDASAAVLIEGHRSWLFENLGNNVSCDKPRFESHASEVAVVDPRSGGNQELGV